MSTLEAEVPRCRALAEKLTSELARQEGELEAMLQAIKGEVEGYHGQLGEVRGGGASLGFPVSDRLFVLHHPVGPSRKPPPPPSSFICHS